MRSGQRGSLALVTGVALLCTAIACTDPPEPESPPVSPQPPPSVYEGAAPPGLAEEPLRFLHGSQSPGQEILNDPRGVRIQAVGDAFLISSNSEEQHLLQGADDGLTRWEGSWPVERFTVDDTGADVFEVSSGAGGASTRTVLDQSGERVWTSSDPRESYLNGFVVRKPADWTSVDPYGEFVIGEPDSGSEWTYEFTEPSKKSEDAEDTPKGGKDSKDSEDSGSRDAEKQRDSEADTAHLGVPVGAHDDVVLLNDGAGMVQARDFADEGALLWHVSGDSADFDDAALSRPRPRLVGFYELPSAPEQATGGAPSTPTSSPSPQEPPAPREVALIRWVSPEEPSLLSLHDLRDGELLWSLREPGANPTSGEFDAVRGTGVVWDRSTGTLLLPQTGGPTPVIAVDLAAGDLRWKFEDQNERSIVPRFALAGYVYGDSRTDDGGSQVVLEAETKDLVVDDLPGYVEAITADGHALVVQNRQRFVFAPQSPQTPPEPTTTPSPSAS